MNHPGLVNHPLKVLYHFKGIFSDRILQLKGAND